MIFSNIYPAETYLSILVKMLHIQETVLRVTFFAVYGSLAYATYTGKTKQFLSSAIERIWAAVRQGNLTWYSF